MNTLNIEPSVDWTLSSSTAASMPFEHDPPAICNDVETVLVLVQPLHEHAPPACDSMPSRTRTVNTLAILSYGTGGDRCVHMCLCECGVWLSGKEAREIDEARVSRNKQGQ